MAQKKYKPEEIVAKLRQVDVLVSQGRSVAEAVRSIGVTQFTYYRWRREYGGLKTDQVKRLKDLEKENQRLRQAVSDLTLEKPVLREAASGNFRAPPAVVAASSSSWRSCTCRNGVRAGSSDSIARHSARCRGVAPTKPP
jgi:putative transposase